MTACAKGNTSIVLMRQSAQRMSVDTKGYCGSTALHSTLVCLHGEAEEAVRMLLGGGADPSITTRDGCTGMAMS